jgi:hypothetical protein
LVETELVTSCGRSLPNSRTAHHLPSAHVVKWLFRGGRLSRKCNNWVRRSWEANGACSDGIEALLQCRLEALAAI